MQPKYQSLYTAWRQSNILQLKYHIVFKTKQMLSYEQTDLTLINLS